MSSRGSSLIAALRRIDDEWYPMLAGTAIGERHLGHFDSADRWERFCREWRDLVELMDHRVAL